eukprot:905922_1
MVSLFCLLTLFLLLRNIYSDSIHCEDSLECTNMDFTINDTIYGWGYKSLFQSPSSSSDVRRCYGALSCAKTPYIHTNELWCHGTSSCSNTGFIEATDVLYGYGSNSVSNTNVTCGAYIRCDGDKSCANSTISSYVSCSMRAYGALSLFGTTVNVISGIFNIFLYGYFAGYESTIYCGNGAVCNVTCAHNGCGGLSLQCHTNSTCNIINQNASALLPNNIIENPEELVLWNSMTTITTNEGECSSQTSDKTFDIRREHYNKPELVYTSNIGPICCRAGEACGMTSISYNCNSIAASIVCSALYSCKHSHVISNDDLNIECSAMRACSNSYIYGNGDINCFGYASRQYANITMMSHIYCTGGFACSQSTISSAESNITLLFNGYQSGYEALVICNENDHCHISCNAYEACLKLTLVCNGTCSVDCDEGTSCPLGWTSLPTITKIPSLRYIDGNVSCNNLYENMGIEYDKGISECMEWCDNTSDCEVFNYFEDFKQIDDSRCYLFDTLCDILNRVF